MLTSELEAVQIPSLTSFDHPILDLGFFVTVLVAYKILIASKEVEIGLKNHFIYFLLLFILNSFKTLFLKMFVQVQVCYKEVYK